MPQGKTYSKRLHRWVNVDRTKAFDYEAVDTESAAFLISFFRAYPDYMADVFRSPQATYKLELPQRFMLRVFARYRDVFITGSRGLTKTYIILLGKMIAGILYPGEKMSYNAPSQKQAAALATAAFHQIEIEYPDIAKQWEIRSDSKDMFRITTRYGSEFTMYAPRGTNFHQSIGEEIGQEGKDPFDIETYERDVLPTVRLERKVNQKLDVTHINLQEAYITNASSRQNKVYYKYRFEALRAMLFGERYEGYVADIPWEVSVICNIRGPLYIKKERAKITIENFKREFGAIYTGSNENPIVTDEILSRCRKVAVMEDAHCGDNNVIYIVSHDVSYEDGSRNAKCADVVLKLTQYQSVTKRDKYKKQIVYADSYPPPATSFLQAQKLKNLWYKYCKKDAQATYLVVDAQAYGREVVEELMKPAKDGLPNLCCYNHMKYKILEQPDALPIIYPLKAGTTGTVDEEDAMLRYAQVEFEQGNIELLTSSILDGIEQYKRKHNIKDGLSDAKIALPYKKTEELCQQIQNLVLKTSGTIKESRKSKSIQRDIWSAAKYALRMAKILEDLLVKKNYQAKSSWESEIKKYSQGNATYIASAEAMSPRGQILKNDLRTQLLQNRRR